ncbi:hypothetical protein C22711_5447 [Escherichia coli O104:H4 str. C227-11]|nr:hypothetical protein C22711_5447 [Escherichia coli O104:H4 str. C227-11]
MQGSQNAFDVNFEAWQLEINHVLEAASAQASVISDFGTGVYQHDYCAAIYISSALWWTRKMIVQPLAIIGAILTALLR